MIVLPIIERSGLWKGAIECVGFLNQMTGEEMEFSGYMIEVLKIVRKIVEGCDFWSESRHEIKSSICKVFDQLCDSSNVEIVCRLSKFISESIGCDFVEIFEIEESRERLRRLNDDRYFTSETGGISYEAGLSSTPVFVHHGGSHRSFRSDIDGLHTNGSIMSVSIMSHRHHWVVTLRGKIGSVAFVSADLSFIREISGIINKTLNLTEKLFFDRLAYEGMKRRRFVSEAIGRSINMLNEGRIDVWKVLRATSRRLFESDTMFVCEYEGMFMRYHPTEVVWGFEDCVSGQAYNYRQRLSIEAENSSFSGELYLHLEVKVRRSISFPYRRSGRVCGCIELINARLELVDDIGCDIFGNFTSIALRDHRFWDPDDLL
jgi:hypothetical protein